MPLTSGQIAASLVALVGAAVACAMALAGGARAARFARVVLVACAALALAAWCRFGALHPLAVDADGSDEARVEARGPFQFHELFHYYLGGKYFAELGYLGLYACAAMGDAEIAEREGRPPRITADVRDLGDILAYEPRDAAIARCAAAVRPRFTPARWAAFEGDLRDLARLVPDDAWNPVVDDAGFNPPPSTAFVYASVANLIPLSAGGLPTWVLLTSIDLALLFGALLCLRAALGAEAAALAAVAFGTSFLASYGWIGGALLRLLWVAAIALGIAALARRRWALGGALLAVAACDRVFPVAFVAGAALPLAVAGARDPAAWRDLARFAAGAIGAAAILVLAGTLAAGAPAWVTFVERTTRYDGLYFVPHLGLRRVLTFRAWVPGQSFRGHEGLATFAAWSARLTETWRSMRPIALPVQVVAMCAATWAAARRRPYEGALLVGVVAMFLFSLPASYYYVVLFLVPAALWRDAMTSSGPARSRAVVALAAFGGFWALALLAYPLWSDDIVASFVLSATFAFFLGVWIAAWSGNRDARSEEVEERAEHPAIVG